MSSEADMEKCSRCGCDMSAEHVFCRHCGAPKKIETGKNEDMADWTCMTCGREVPENFSFCPQCGRPSIIPFYPYPNPAPQPEYHEDPALLHFILFSIALVMPLVGFVLGYLMTRPDHSPDDRHVGRICILLALVWPILAFLVLIRILLLF
jgi:hypothetical protein